MPELPEVETIARGLNAQAGGQRIAQVRLITPKVLLRGDPKALAGRRIDRVTRRAKLLLIVLDNDDVLVFHLKMTGRVWLGGAGQTWPKHTHLVLHLESGDQIIFEDQRRFGYFGLFSPTELAAWDFYARLGPEPLDTTPQELAARLRGRKASIKSLLLNQTVMAGIGNIYADESLFAARIHPAGTAAAIPKKRLITLCAELQRILSEAIAAGGSTFSDYRNAYGKSGIFQEYFQVYGKKGEPCPACRQPLVAVTVAGRTSTHCSHCQRRY
jgi:formamidopyrimidine-DNA glycosylase